MQGIYIEIYIMLKKNRDLNGSAPDENKLAILIIDMINDFNFEDGKVLLSHAEKIAKNILQLKKIARDKKIPIIYVNDNFGKWKSDFKILVDHCISENTPGKKIAQMLKPDQEDYFVLKPKHSGFFSTTLEILLEHLNTETLILTGITTDICVLFTANDAYMRDYKIVIPFDCVAAVTESQHTKALENIARATKAEILPFKNLNLEKYLKDN